MQTALPLIALLALAPLCVADESPLQKQLRTCARITKDTQDTPEKGRAIWEGKQSAAIEDFAAVSTYAHAIFKTNGQPSYLVSPDQNVILCHAVSHAQEPLQRFAAFHREGDRFVCKNHLDFYSVVSFAPEETAFESQGAVLTFRQDCNNGPQVKIRLKLSYDTPWDKSCFLPTNEDANRFLDGPTWRFVHAVEQMDTATIAEFLRNGYMMNVPTPDQLREKYGESSLFFSALRRCRDEELARALPLLLQNCGANLNARDKHGWGVLHISQYMNRKPRAIKVLLDAGADPNTADVTGQTPLMLAAARFDPATVKNLLAAGADVKAQDVAGATAMHRVLHPRFDTKWPYGRSPEEFERYTKEICAEILDTAQLLLAAGADINAADKDGRTPIFTMLNDSNNIPEMGIQILLPQLVKLGADLTHQDITGQTFADSIPEWRKGTKQLVKSLLSEKKD